MNEQNILVKSLEETYIKVLDIARRKNADYADNADPFKNFKMCEQFGVSAEQGILVRISDKISRIGNLLNKEAQVKDESINDTIEDAINYLAILKAYLINK